MADEKPVVVAPPAKTADPVAEGKKSPDGPKMTPQEANRRRIEDSAKKPGERDTVMEGLISDFKAKGSSVIKGKDAAKAKADPQTTKDAPVGDVIKPAAPDDPKAEIEKVKTGMQARIDELTAKVKEMERSSTETKTPSEKKEPATLAELSDQQLIEMLAAAEDRMYGAKKDEITGDIIPGDRKQNVSVAEAVREERMRRKQENAGKADREVRELSAAQDKSLADVAQKYGKYLFSKKEDGSLFFDEALPVAKRVKELQEVWSKDQNLSKHPELPRLLVEAALGQVSSTADFDSLKKIHRLETEIEKLKAGTRMDYGKPGSEMTREEEQQEQEETPADLINQRRAMSNRGRGIMAPSR